MEIILKRFGRHPYTGIIVSETKDYIVLLHHATGDKMSDIFGISSFLTK